MTADPTLVVIGSRDGETSLGPIVVGEMRRLPFLEALQLTHAGTVTLADWHEQQRTDPPDTKRRYRRRDLRAEG